MWQTALLKRAAASFCVPTEMAVAERLIKLETITAVAVNGTVMTEAGVRRCAGNALLAPGDTVSVVGDLITGWRRRSGFVHRKCSKRFLLIAYADGSYEVRDGGSFGVLRTGVFKHWPAALAGEAAPFFAYNRQGDCALLYTLSKNGAAGEEITTYVGFSLTAGKELFRVDGLPRAKACGICLEVIDRQTLRWGATWAGTEPAGATEKVLINRVYRNEIASEQRLPCSALAMTGDYSERIAASEAEIEALRVHEPHLHTRQMRDYYGYPTQFNAQFGYDSYGWLYSDSGAQLSIGERPLPSAWLGCDSAVSTNISWAAGEPICEFGELLAANPFTLEAIGETLVGRQQVVSFVTTVTLARIDVPKNAPTEWEPEWSPTYHSAVVHVPLLGLLPAFGSFQVVAADYWKSRWYTHWYSQFSQMGTSVFGEDWYPAVSKWPDKEYFWLYWAKPPLASVWSPDTTDFPQIGDACLVPFVKELPKAEMAAPVLVAMQEKCAEGIRVTLYHRTPGGKWRKDGIAVMPAETNLDEVKTFSTFQGPIGPYPSVHYDSELTPILWTYPNGKQVASGYTAVGTTHEKAEVAATGKISFERQTSAVLSVANRLDLTNFFYPSAYVVSLQQRGYVDPDPFWQGNLYRGDAYATESVTFGAMYYGENIGDAERVVKKFDSEIVNGGGSLALPYSSEIHILRYVVNDAHQDGALMVDDKVVSELAYDKEKCYAVGDLAEGPLLLTTDGAYAPDRSGELVLMETFGRRACNLKLVTLSDVGEL